jgi:hypothetical protein
MISCSLSHNQVKLFTFFVQFQVIFNLSSNCIYLLDCFCELVIKWSLSSHKVIPAFNMLFGISFKF